MSDYWFDLFEEIDNNFEGFKDIDPIIDRIKLKHNLLLFIMVLDYPGRILHPKRKMGIQVVVKIPKDNMSEVIVRCKNGNEFVYNVKLSQLERKLDKIFSNINQIADDCKNN